MLACICMKSVDIVSVYTKLQCNLTQWFALHQNKTKRNESKKTHTKIKTAKKLFSTAIKMVMFVH